MANWFKKAQYTYTPETPRGLNSLDIGHSGLNSPGDIGHDWDENLEYENYLWVWTNNELDIKAEETPMDTHDRIWGDETMKKIWSGRYDEKQNVISVLPPIVGNVNDIPFSLINALSKQLSPDAPVILFEPGKSARVVS